MLFIRHFSKWYHLICCPPNYRYRHQNGVLKCTRNEVMLKSSKLLIFSTNICNCRAKTNSWWGDMIWYMAILEIWVAHCQVTVLLPLHTSFVENNIFFQILHHPKFCYTNLAILGKRTIHCEVIRSERMAIL